MSELFRNSISRPVLQRVWLILLKLCHAGMNYGGGQSVETSGERYLLSRFARRAPRRKPVIFDVGANSGEYARLCLSVLDSNLSLECFEPQSSSFEDLKRELGDRPGVRLHNIALGATPGSTFLSYVDESEPTARITGRGKQGRGEMVQTETLDQVCERLAVDSVDLLKLDTEGFEIPILLGASRMLSEKKLRNIQFEFGDTFLGTGFYFKTAWDLLSPGYRIFRVLRSGVHEIPRYSPDLEVFKIANFLCIMREEPCWLS